MKRTKLLVFCAVFFVLLAPALMAQKMSTYNVRLSTNVKGADLFVDGKYLGKLPGEFKIAFGKHTLKASAPGYNDYEQIIRIDSNLNMMVTLEQGVSVPPTVAPVMEYKVSINCNVNHADIFLDGVFRAKTPAMILLKPGSYNLKVMASGYSDATQQLVVNGDTAYTITLQSLVVYYPLEVNANLGGARVFINGKDSGEAPVNLNLAEGNYNVKVVKRDYADFEQNVQLNKATRINAVLQPMHAYVKIILPFPPKKHNLNDKFQRINVYLDDKEMKGFEFPAPQGVHRVRISAGFLVLETTIDFIPGKFYELKPGLNVEVK